MKISYIEANEPKDLTAAINDVKGAEAVSFIVRGNRVGAFVKTPDDYVPVAKVKPTRPKAALEYEAKMKAQAEAEAKAAKEEAKANPPEVVESEVVAGANLGRSPKTSKKARGKGPGPIVE